MSSTGLAFFDLYELPISLKVDKSIIQKKFYALSRQYHPDNFSLSSSDEQEQALHKTAAINKAKRILDDTYLRLEYILKEKDVIQEDEKYQLPMDFLSEMMELNEEKMEWMMSEDEETKTEWKRKVEQILFELKTDVTLYFESEDLNEMDVEWQALKDYYYKRKYLDRIMG